MDALDLENINKNVEVILEIFDVAKDKEDR